MATAIMAVAAIFVGRFLGPDLYGEHNLVILVPQLLLLFSDLGIIDEMTRFAASLSVERKRD